MNKKFKYLLNVKTWTWENHNSIQTMKQPICRFSITMIFCQYRKLPSTLEVVLWWGLMKVTR